jgi:hypothetical protein
LEKQLESLNKTSNNPIAQDIESKLQIEIRKKDDEITRLKKELTLAKLDLEASKFILNDAAKEYDHLLNEYAQLSKNHETKKIE